MAFNDLPNIKKVKYLFQSVTIEPVFFLFAMNFGFFAVASQQLYVDKMCQVNLNHSKEICDNIYSHKEIQLDVQERVTRLKTINSVIQGIPSFFYSLIAGPWCDKHGRKPLIIISILGSTVSTTVFLINTIWWYQLKAEYLLLECIQGDESYGTFDYSSWSIVFEIFIR